MVASVVAVTFAGDCTEYIAARVPGRANLAARVVAHVYSESTTPM